VPSHYPFVGDEMETTDYFIIGDIVLVSSLSLLSSTSYNRFQLVPTGKKASEAQLDYQPYLQITGIIDSVAPDCSYWDMCPEQYIAGFNRPQDKVPGGVKAKPCLPIRILVPSNNRWSGKSKLNPKPGSYAAVSGHVSGLDRDKDTNRIIRLLVDLNGLVYLGKAAYVASATNNAQANKGQGRS